MYAKAAKTVSFSILTTVLFACFMTQALATSAKVDVASSTLVLTVNDDADDTASPPVVTYLETTEERTTGSDGVSATHYEGVFSLNVEDTDIDIDSTVSGDCSYPNASDKTRVYCDQNTSTYSKVDLQLSDAADTLYSHSFPTDYWLSSSSDYFEGNFADLPLSINTGGSNDSITYRSDPSFTADNPLTISGGDGTDTITASGTDSDYFAPSSDTLVTIDGGAGVDYIYGDSVQLVKEVIDGGDDGDYIAGYDGNDVISGGAGDDIFENGTDLSDDSYDGGDGSDTVSYSENEETIFATAGDSEDNGKEVMESDTFTDIENITGGDGNDTLTGDSAANTLIGAGGNDTIKGKGGDDTLLGDGYSGFCGSSASGGDDIIKAGSGDDAVVGCGGNDTIDITSALNPLGDPEKDTASCGGGDDTLAWDRSGDTQSDCETLTYESLFSINDEFIGVVDGGETVDPGDTTVDPGSTVAVDAVTSVASTFKWSVAGSQKLRKKKFKGKVTTTGAATVKVKGVLYIKSRKGKKLFKKKLSTTVTLTSAGSKSFSLKLSKKNYKKALKALKKNGAKGTLTLTGSATNQNAAIKTSTGNTKLTKKVKVKR